MFAPIFEVCAADSEVTALIGSNPVRLFLFGMAPQNVALPYVVWQTSGGNPENYLGDLPDADNFSIQIDVYASTAATARQVAQAVRDAIESNAYVVSWIGDSIDPDTKHRRYTFLVDWIVER